MADSHPQLSNLDWALRRAAALRTHSPSPLSPYRTLDSKKINPVRIRKTPPRIGPAERRYATQLRRLSQYIGQLVENTREEGLGSLADLLNSYASAITPWARRVASQMIGEVNDRDRQSWHALGNAISLQLRRDLDGAPIGDRVQHLLAEQVELIRSIPLDAAERVHRLTVSGLTSSSRAREVAKEIARTSEVTASRATLIARTETSRTATTLTQARCEVAGLTHYIWRTSGDGDVRLSHQAMAGKVCEWADPPAVRENGRIMHFHPGTIWNCRCYPEPILSDSHERADRRAR